MREQPATTPRPRTVRAAPAAAVSRWFLPLRPLRPLVGLLIALAVAAPGAATATTTWSRNLYLGSAFLYQDPYMTACTAAASMTMLNTIALRGTGGRGFIWTPTRVKNDADPANQRDLMSILAFERANDTLRAASRGTDPHGWRNALNAYGWGTDAMTDASQRVYDDREYRTFKGAVRAAVRAIARRSMPVGILGWAGSHAQVITGYVVTGADPRVSNDFTVRYVYLSDPLQRDGTVNRRISFEKLRTGPLRTRFQAYRQGDSPYDDPLTAGTIRSSVVPSRGRSEWYHRWVVLLPLRNGLPDPGPTPTPTPTPSPDPTPSADPTPTPDATGTPGVGANALPPAPTHAPAPTPDVTPSPTPEATRPPEPTSPPDPTPPPDPAPPTVDPTPTQEPTPGP